MPGVVWPQQDLWYSFDIGRAHIISISSEVYFLSNQYLAQQQYSWLIQDLQTANNQKQRSDRPWIIVMLNQPLYCSGTPSCYANSAVLRDELEELMHTQGVDLVLTAQDNLFQRTWPVYKGKVKTESYLDPAGTVYINTGALTCDNVSTSTELCQETWCAKKIPLNGAPSFGILSIHNKTHLLYEERDAASRDLLDSTWLIQHHHGPYGALTGHHPLVISVVVVLTLTIAFIAFLCVWGRKVKRYMKYQRDMAANKRNGNAFNFTSLDETELGPAEGVENDGQDRPNSQLQPIPAISEGVANGVVHSQNKHKTRTKTKNTYIALSEQPCEEC
ncbi:acid phosphatase type 7-like [Lingula anatina]|uniref:Acid phosphatase type 7-like n=1 Tax=Lingula anatina TaxID=7574 RepID=A0A1S3J786_LINAN|nr:acid phosphatase type 7-like [Lingula anatina]|eukprot:XP_013406173.1 acid phosphatase type 7-like [Lingula anatina]